MCPMFTQNHVHSLPTDVGKNKRELFKSMQTQVAGGDLKQNIFISYYTGIS